MGILKSFCVTKILKGTQKGARVPIVWNEERLRSFFQDWNAFLKIEERLMLWLKLILRTAESIDIEEIDIK